MLWGWLRRSVAERRLAQAEKLLGRDPQGASLEALIGLSELLEARDARTYGHSQRVTRHAERIATTMGLPAAEVAKVRTAAALHDVGKLHTPRSILNKPGRLTDSEFALIKRHPVDGAVMASGIGDPEITAMIRHHHERLDGRGYPDGLAGEDIPLGARIIAVADTFDAITSNRTYRRASHHKRALDVLASEAGKQLDGDAVAAFRGYYRGQRTVALSALIAAAPQRFLSWLGGASPAIGAGAASATSLLIGLGNSQPAVYSPDSAVGTPAPLVALGPEARERRRRGGRAPDAARRPVSAAARKAAAAAPTAARGNRRPGATAARRHRARRRRRHAPPRRSPAAAAARRARPPRSRAPDGRPAAASTCRASGSPRCRSPEVTVPAGHGARGQGPGVELPGVRTPEIKTPEIKTPEIKLPEIKTPASSSPASSSPDGGEPAALLRALDAPTRTPRAGPPRAAVTGAKPSSSRARELSAAVCRTSPDSRPERRTSSGRPAIEASSSSAALTLTGEPPPML